MSSNNKHNDKLTPLAQQLRKNMTKEERHLWYDFLKQLPITVNRQKVIGRYIVDFYCASSKLAIELDGSQHFDNVRKSIDLERDNYFHGLGITVKRYSNNEVSEDFEAVCNDIRYFLFPEEK
ncbi:endonuclease domain-containing protein [Chloroflexota bacterium]|nr:endonuclease domain-containing protein [Chloroflexota bacterium]